MLKQLCEHPSLIIGDDSVADARERDGLPIGGHSLDHEDHGGHESEPDYAPKALVEVGLIDNVPDQISAEGSSPHGHPHHGEVQRIAPPLSGGLLQHHYA